MQSGADPAKIFYGLGDFPKSWTNLLYLSDHVGEGDEVFPRWEYDVQKREKTLFLCEFVAMLI